MKILWLFKQNRKFYYFVTNCFRKIKIKIINDINRIVLNMVIQMMHISSIKIIYQNRDINLMINFQKIILIGSII